MKFSKLALVIGSTLAVAAGAFVGTACSSSSTNSGSGSGSGGTMDSGSGSDTSTEDSGSTGTDSGSTGTDSGSTGVDAGCKDVKLHTDTAGSIYCGYGADGGAFSCPTGNQCCLGGEIGMVYQPQECSAWTATGAGCNNPAADAGAASAGIGIACNQVSDCTANGATGAVACCLQGATLGAVAGCTYQHAKDGNAIVCESSDAGSGTGACLSTELQVCSADADCPSGKTCTAVTWKIFQIGICM